MGIDFHVANFLNHISLKQKKFGRTLTLGRQNLVLPGSAPGAYSENYLMKNHNASSVDSLDLSNFEGATIILDLNKEIPASYHNQFDTIIDAGTLEHVFNVKQALENLVHMLKQEGQIIHISPTNGFSGHGFYQFSFEFFKKMYSKENGFKDHEVFVAEVDNQTTWYKVRTPAGHLRFNVYGIGRLYMMSRAVKSFNGNTQSIQQTDYEFHWSAQPPDPAIQETKFIDEWDSRPKNLIGKILRRFNLLTISSVSNLHPRNPFIECLHIKDLDHS